MSTGPQPPGSTKSALLEALPSTEASRPGANLSADRQDLLWAILENLSEGVVACDANGTLSFFNRATREFHGIVEEPIGPQDWVGRYSLNRLDGTPMKVEEIPLFRALHGEIVRDALMVIAPDNLEARTVICSGRPLYDRGGRLLGAVVVQRDITQQLVAEQQKADLVHERERSRAKDELLATVSHELRNPLTSILAWTHLLETNNADTSMALPAIANSARMLGRLVNDLSDASLIASGKLDLNRELLILGDLLENVIAAARPIADRKRVAITGPGSIEPLSLNGDSVRLQQVFWNLLTNALKFTPAGGTASVTVRADDDSVQVEVRDSGRGIDPEFLPRVFDRYAQEKSGSREQPGLGLGLSIARTIVEVHGGRITAASAGEGSGATFVVTLPRTGHDGSDTGDVRES
jgi:signal transduction histidine kinase